MQKLTFSDDSEPTIGIMIKEASMKKGAMLEYYVSPLIEEGVPVEQIACYSLEYPPSGKVTAKQAKNYLDCLLPDLLADGIDTLMVCDAEYFKRLTGSDKAEANLGYVLPCKIIGYEKINIVLGSSYTVLFHNPAVQQKINTSVATVASFFRGQYLPPGSDIFKKIELVKDMQRIKDLLAHLMTLPAITADIETLSLDFWKAGISTIAFGEDTEVGYSFAVDTHMGLGKPVKKLLKDFFTNYQGKIIWHNIGYDAKVLIYELWMKDPLDRVGMLEGISIMTRNFDCTRLIAYLALNSCVRTQHSLKVLAQEFAGNYAEQNINDAANVPVDDLLRYNIVDTLATWYVHNKFKPVMIADMQEDLYEGLFKSSVALLLEIELTGMPLNMDKVLFAEKELTSIKDKHTAILKSSQIVQSFNHTVKQAACDARNEKLKVKRVSVTDAEFDAVEFNPASGPQLQKLLYEVLGLPIIDKTKKKKPATGNKTLAKLKNHTTDPSVLEMLDALIEIIKVNKILEAFIPTFKDAWLKADGCYYLHGNFKLGFVVSGRLSCAKPNLQQIPSGSTYAKLIKDCFMPAKGWLMAGADFSSLEDKINALLTKDPNKLKVYTDGYDGHAFRTKFYWPDQTPDIDNSVASINSMAEKSSPYYGLRSKSKAPTFALTFLGTYITLMNNCGFTEAEAKAIEANYHTMYAVSAQWVKDKIMEASKIGYSTGAFGLRIRTPLLQQCIYGGKFVPKEAQAEARTLGNAISGQSYGLLNNRAAVEFRERVLASPYRYDVKIIALIHDAIYLLIRNHIDVVHWVNENLPECMQWQDLPELQHPTVKLGGDLDLFYPSWKTSYTLPNHATKEEIVAITLTPKN
jgi:DNA polymerase-1